MRVVVYPLRRNGEKLTKEEVRAGGVEGWLRMGKYDAMSPPERHAWLLKGPDGRPGLDDLLPSLRFVELRKIEKGGLLLRGQDPRQSWDTTVTRQFWWVVPVIHEKM